MANNEVKIKVTLDDGQAQSSVKKLKADFTDAGKAGNEGFTVVKGALSNLASTAITTAASAVTNFAGSIVEIGQNFETSMSKVSALSGATGDDLAQLEAKARELGASTTFSASQAADALGYMALAGWDTKDMLDGVSGVLSLAQAGEMDLAAASDLVTDYLSAFNMTAADTQRMVDVLAYAQANANTTVEGLGMAFKNCAANCNAFGMDVETTSAAIAMMANQGLKGSEAGTALNAVMRDMTARMKDGAISIGDTSVAIMDAEGNYRDFADIIADIEAATNGMGDAEKAAALQSTFTADSIKGLNLMLNAGSDELVGFRDDLYGCAGAAEKTAATMTDNLGGDLSNLQSALEETALKIYDGLQEPLRATVQFITGTAIPGLQGFMDWMSSGTEVFDEFGNKVGETASPIQTLVSALQGTLPVLAAAGGALLAYKGYSLAVAAAEKARAAVTLAVETAQKLLNGTMRANPIGIVITLIGALVGAFIYLWNTSEEFRNFWTGLWGAICEAAQPVIDWLVANVVEPMMATFADLQARLGELWATLCGAFSAAWEQFAPILEAAFAILQELFSAYLPVIQAYWDGVWNQICIVFQTVWNVISTVVTTVMGVIQGIITTVMGVIQGDWGMVWEGISQIASSIWSGIQSLVGAAINFVSSTISNVMGTIASMWQAAWSGISSFLGGCLESIKTAVSDGINSVISFFTDLPGNILNALGDLGSLLWNAGSQIVSGLFQGIKSAIGGVYDFVSGIGAKIASLKGPKEYDLKLLIPNGGWIMQSLATGLRRGMPEVRRTLKGIASEIGGYNYSAGLRLQGASFGIDWYKTGGIFNSASVIGVGEAGPEAVVPLSGRQMQPFAQAIAEQMGGTGSTVVNQSNYFQAVVKSPAEYERAARLSATYGLARNRKR